MEKIVCNQRHETPSQWNCSRCNSSSSTQHTVNNWFTEFSRRCIRTSRISKRIYALPACIPNLWFTFSHTHHRDFFHLNHFIPRNFGSTKTIRQFDTIHSWFQPMPCDFCVFIHQTRMNFHNNLHAHKRDTDFITHNNQISTPQTTTENFRWQAKRFCTKN